ncbi:MAG TPA: DUF5666 domain-containing protein [Methylomirabilota bacterium]|nr:DUF5666 domain-containing protein [Methylomirabilota bacterium]
MKKQLFILVTLLFFVSIVAPVHAVSPTPTPKGLVNQQLDQKINELKDKIASRVSELNLVEKRAMIGVVSGVSGNTVTLSDVAGQTQFVDVDEITKFSSASNNTFGLSDLKKGTRITVLGLYNKQSKRILARFMRTTIDPTFINGAIASLDSKNFYVTVATPDQKQIKIDIEVSSKILSYDKDSGQLIKLGFSKLAIGDRVNIIGYPDKKDSTMLVASRLIDLASLPKNPKIIISQPSPIETITPTPSTTLKNRITPTITR